MLGGWLSFWVFPLFAGVVWLAMLLAMLLWWITKGSPHLPSFNQGQTIAYISDVGAQELKPLFITMSTVTVVTLDLTLIFERWLRHTGRLTHNTSMFQKALSILSIIASIAGAAGLILLSIFDTLHHPKLHDKFLALFIAGYILSAIFVCWEYQRLGIHYRQHSILRMSFWLKLAFIIVELALAVGFGVENTRGKFNVAAIIEWIIAFVFTFYVTSFAVDFVPALRSRQGHVEATQIGMAEDPAGYQDTGYLNAEPAFARDFTVHTPNGHANGVVNGAPYKPPQPAEPATNF